MGDEGQRRYLVLAMGTLAGPGPATELLRLSRRQPSLFHVVVPVTVPEYGWTWTEGQALRRHGTDADHDRIRPGHGLEHRCRGRLER
jgi:hypothetical protein